MAEPGDLDSAFMSGFTEANVSAAESAHRCSDRRELLLHNGGKFQSWQVWVKCIVTVSTHGICTTTTRSGNQGHTQVSK
jgi:hypothetical protein